MKKVKIYTDGACKGNPGKGGWGAVLQYGETEKELSKIGANLLIESLKKIENGVSFTPYNHTLDLFGTPTEFLGYTDDGTTIRVWKCLFNGSGATISNAPHQDDDSNTGVFIQTDGYHWKYLYSFAKTSVFNTNDTNFKWMPVESLQLKPSDSQLLKQWNVLCSFNK